MNTNLNRTGRILFSAGILIWVSAMILNDFHLISSAIKTLLLSSGVGVELFGFIVVMKNGGFKKSRFCKTSKS